MQYYASISELGYGSEKYVRCKLFGHVDYSIIMTYRKVSISTRIFEKTNSVIAWVSGTPVLLVRYNDKYYAMNPVCSHMGCALIDYVEGREAVCPAHGARFDVTTGDLLAEAKIKPEMKCEYSDSRNPLKTYNVRENKGFLEVDL
ncbi:MAG: Rieske (2Fe-2S) protein [Thermoplasmata archaeon]